MIISKAVVKKSCCLFFIVVMAMAVWTVPAMAVAPVVSDFIITDVTTRSFSVVWTSSESSTPDLNVFDQSCADITATLSIDSMPVEIGDPTLTGAAREASILSIKNTAESNGVMKVRVTSLSMATTYYVQTKTTSNNLPNDVTYNPDPNNCTADNQVVTEVRTVRSKTEGVDIVPFSNDLLLKELTPALGTLVVADVDGSSYPVSAFLGDGVQLPNALIDLNNVFGMSSNENIEVLGDEIVKLLHIKGYGNETHRGYACPENSQMASILTPGLLNQLVEFEPNWNLVSFQLVPEASDVATVFGPIMSNVNIIWAYEASSKKWLSYNPTGPVFLNTLTDVQANVGYQIKMNAGTSLSVDGAWQLDPISLPIDWNFIGHYGLSSETPSDAFTDIAGTFDIVWGYDASVPEWLSFNPTGPVFLNDLDNIDPSKGYMIKMNQPAAL